MATAVIGAHAYELAKQVQRSLGWFWPRAERKLYDEPKRLVEQGLATATSASTMRRTRSWSCGGSLRSRQIGPMSGHASE